MPVLDTIMWIGREQRELGVPKEMLENSNLVTAKAGTLQRVVQYTFFCKPMANPLSNLRSSAQPEGMKVPTACEKSKMQ